MNKFVRQKIRSRWHRHLQIKYGTKQIWEVLAFTGELNVDWLTTALNAKGNFVEPTIFVNVSNDMRIAQEEIFGPVLSVINYKNVDQAISMANDSIYGLSAGVWSANTNRAKNVASRLRAGMVWINEWHILSELAPFGGYKQSGNGREFGDVGLNEYTELKTLYVDDAKTRKNKPWYDMVV